MHAIRERFDAIHCTRNSRVAVSTRRPTSSSPRSRPPSPGVLEPRRIHPSAQCRLQASSESPRVLGPRAVHHFARCRFSSWTENYNVVFGTLLAVSISKGHTQRRMSLLNASECKHHHPHHHYHQHRIINADEDGHADSRRWCWRWSPGDGGGLLFRVLRHHSDEALLLVQRQLYTRASRAPFFVVWLARSSLTTTLDKTSATTPLKRVSRRRRTSGCDS